jgi:hypothetical protein
MVNSKTSVKRLQMEREFLKTVASSGETHLKHPSEWLVSTLSKLQKTQAFSSTQM